MKHARVMCYISYWTTTAQMIRFKPESSAAEGPRTCVITITDEMKVHHEAINPTA
jgi:hypothetical protein